VVTAAVGVVGRSMRDMRGSRAGGKWARCQAVLEAGRAVRARDNTDYRGED